MPKRKIMTDLANAQWFKSTFSGGNSDNCVEIAFVGTSIAVRDSKDPTGGAQVYDRSEWKAFMDGAKAGEFDL